MISGRFSFKTGAMDLLYQLRVAQDEIPTLKDLRDVHIWLFLLVLNLFCQGEEPLEVKGDTNEIPFAFHCLQST